MKKVVPFFTLIVLIFANLFFTNVTEASQTNKISVYLDNFPLKFDVEPRMVSNRTLVPFRKLSESIGIKVRWDGPTRSIYATGNGKDVILTIDSKEAVVNGKTVILDAPPFIEKGHTLIPLRFFVENFDATVGWSQKERKVMITSPTRDLYSFSFYALGSVGHRHYVPAFDGIAYGWSGINPDGEFITSRRDNGILQDYYWPGDLPEVTTAEIIQSGQANGGDAYLMVAALDYETVSTLVHDSAKTDVAISKMVETALTKGLDGIFIDFEGIRNTDAHLSTKKAFTAFIEKLALETKKNRLALSVALVPPNNAFSGYEYEKIAKVVDSIFLMAYDYHPREAIDPFAHMRPEPLVQINKGIELSLKLIPKEKLILGVNLVHEDNHSIPNVIGLAKRHNLKGVGFWLLNRLNEEKILMINKSVKLK